MNTIENTSTTHLRRLITDCQIEDETGLEPGEEGWDEDNGWTDADDWTLDPQLAQRHLHAEQRNN